MDQQFGRQNCGNHPSGTGKKNKKKNENSLRDNLDSIKHTNIHIIGFSEGEEKEKADNLLEEIVAENFANLEKKQTFRSKRYRVF